MEDTEDKDRIHREAFELLTQLVSEARICGNGMILSDKVTVEVSEEVGYNAVVYSNKAIKYIMLPSKQTKDLHIVLWEL